MLLERAGRERRRRLLLAVLLLDLGHHVRRPFERLDDWIDLHLSRRLELLAVPFRQFGDERPLGNLLFLLCLRLGFGFVRRIRCIIVVVGRLRFGRLFRFRLGDGGAAVGLRPQDGGDLPEFFRFERLDLAFAFHDEPHRDRLHPAGGQVIGLRQAQERAELVTDDAVEEAAGLLGGDAVHVDTAGAGKGLLHRVLGDLVEGDPANFFIIEFQRFLQMPGNRLPLAVGVRRQIDDVGGVCLLLELGQQLLAVLQIAIGRNPAAFDVDAELGFDQIAHVPLAGDDIEAGAEIFVDRLRLGGRFDDDERFFLPCGHCGLLQGLAPAGGAGLNCCLPVYGIVVQVSSGKRQTVPR